MSHEENLFNFGRELPQPFENFPKKVQVASQYGISNSTMVGSVLKAILAVFNCMNGTGRGGVGTLGNQYMVAEYKSSVDEQIHLVIYNKTNHSVMASVYDPTTNGTLEQYKCNRANRDGAAILFALMPLLLTDAEFSDNFNLLYNEFQNNWNDMSRAVSYAGILHLIRG